MKKLILLLPIYFISAALHAAVKLPLVVGFAIAGADKKFVWAEAGVEGGSIVVSSAKVPSPVAVRHAWEDNPAYNLYNAAGLPASPFRAEPWPVPGAPKKSAK